MPTDIELPKIIHFIWAGGSKQMGQDNKQRVLAWAKKHPDFKIFIWVDYKSARGDTDAEKQQKVDEHFEDIKKGSNNIIIKDVYMDLFSESFYANVLVYTFFKHEIDKLRPNYGMSSDMLRYSLLYNFGGAYFDSDISPGTKKLDEEVAFGSQPYHGLWADDNSQNSECVGNDAFISTPENPVIKYILDKALENYKKQWFFLNTQQLQAYAPRNIFKAFPDACDSFQFIRDYTPWITGPRVVGEVLSGDNNDLFLQQRDALDKDKSKLKPEYREEVFRLPSTCRSLDEEKPNEAEWTNMPLRFPKKDKSFEELLLLQRMVRLDAFELKNMHLWRLNDTFYNYYEITGKYLDLDKYINYLKDFLQAEGCSLNDVIKESDFVFQDLKSLADCKTDLRRCTESVKQILGHYAVRTGKDGVIRESDIDKVNIEEHEQLINLNNAVLDIQKNTTNQYSVLKESIPHKQTKDLKFKT